jgi:tRNA-dihydrouridine synthase B
MAGLSSLPYRILAMENGCALTISEMVSAEGAIRGGEKTSRYFKNDRSVRPFGVQLFGTNPDSFIRAIEEMKDLPVDLIDINSGCPVHKVCKKGSGAALMKTPQLIEKIVRACKNASALPVTLKIRAGWDKDSINCVEVAKMAEAAGADAITIHGRTQKQLFGGRACLEWIGLVKKAVSIPVIGNGDIKTRALALTMIEETGCDAVMIGRAAVGNPWIFKKILDENYDGPSDREKGLTAIRHLEMIAAMMGEKRAVSNMKAVLPWYTKGMCGVRQFMRIAMCENDPVKFKNAIASFFGISDPCAPNTPS